MTCLQSFMVWYCSVCELRESNSKKNKMKNFGAYGIFYLTPFPCTNLHDFLVSGIIWWAESREAVKFHIETEKVMAKCMAMDPKPWPSLYTKYSCTVLLHIQITVTTCTHMHASPLAHIKAQLCHSSSTFSWYMYINYICTCTVHYMHAHTMTLYTLRPWTWIINVKLHPVCGE